MLKTSKKEHTLSIHAPKKDAPPCGLWLRLGPDLALDILTRDLKQIFFAINSTSYKKNMHTLEISGDENDKDFKDTATLLFALARAHGITTIFRGTAQSAHELEADGVLLDNLDDLTAARKLFEEDGIIGISCGLSNEKAAAAYDAAVDFVTFGTSKNTLPDAQILKFWTILTDHPAVIEGPVSNDYCAYYVEAGASFIDARDYIWSHSKGVMQGTVNMLHAIDLALENKNTGKAQ